MSNSELATLWNQAEASNNAQSYELLAQKLPSKLQQAMLNLSTIGLASSTSASNGASTSQISDSQMVLELGAYMSVLKPDLATLQRYYAILSPLYASHPSSNQTRLTGLYLLSLLAQGNLAQLHLVIEALSPEVLANDHVTFARQIEAAWIEGDYARIWALQTASHQTLGHLEKAMLNILLKNVRTEIGKSLSLAYSTLPIQAAANLLFMNSSTDVMTFAESQKWQVNQQAGVITFPASAERKDAERARNMAIPRDSLVNTSLRVARELESIV